MLSEPACIFAAVSSHTIVPNSSMPPNIAAPANNTPIIAAVVAVLAVAAIAIIAVILIIVVVVRKKKRKAYLCERSSSHIQVTAAVNNNLDNPMYSGMYIHYRCLLTYYVNSDQPPN